MTRAATSLIVDSVIALGAVRAATAPTDQSSPSDSAALLNEVRLLRQAIEQLAGNGTRVKSPSAGCNCRSNARQRRHVGSKTCAQT